jgi:hypothetical protein
VLWQFVDALLSPGAAPSRRLLLRCAASGIAPFLLEERGVSVWLPGEETLLSAGFPAFVERVVLCGERLSSER